MKKLNLFPILFLLHVVSSRFVLINTKDKDDDATDYEVEITGDEMSREYSLGDAKNRIIAPGIRWGDYIEKRPSKGNTGRGRDYTSYDYEEFYPVRALKLLSYYSHKESITLISYDGCE